MHRAPKTRFLIASGAQARWVEHLPDLPDLVTVGQIAPTGVHHHTHGPAHVSSESADRGEAARHLEDFARQIAEAVNRQARNGEFERLALVAPPRLLRAVREHLDGAVRTKICFELPKDLTKHSNHALRRWLHAPEIA
jgi:protein required for attachment to host cells